jgi:hypothetical protein
VLLAGQSTLGICGEVEVRQCPERWRQAKWPTIEPMTFDFDLEQGLKVSAQRQAFGAGGI